MFRKIRRGFAEFPYRGLANSTICLALVISDESLDKEIMMSNENTKSISGTVHYLRKIGLAPNSTLQVSLQDVSVADAPAKQLATQVIRNAETAGLSFNLEYSTADIQAGHTYAISAQIESEGRLIFINTEHFPVELGVDYLQPLDIRVDNVAAIAQPDA
jgi:putative lipoprotein